MPADRRIRLDIQEVVPRDEFSEHVDGPITSYYLWALVEDQGSSEEATTGGSIIRLRKSFTVRWNEAIVLGYQGFMEVIDEYGGRYNVEEIQENSGRRNRRKFIEIVGVRTG